MARDLDARHRMLIFRATPWSDRDVRRVFELAPDHTLADLHRGIVDELNLDDDHLWAFYLSGEWFDRTSEFDGNPEFTGKAQTTKVGELGLAPEDLLAYVCDFGDEQRVDVELLGYGDASDLDRPRILERAGVAQGRSFEWNEDDAEDADEAPDAPTPRDASVHLDPAETAALEAALAAWDSDGEDDTRRISLDVGRIASKAAPAAAAAASAAGCRPGSVARRSRSSPPFPNPKAGDAALSRRAKAKSPVHAVVVRQHS